MDAYTIPEAARVAGLSPREVRMRIEEGDLRAFIRAGRRMVDRSELEQLLDRHAPPQPALRAAPPPEPRVGEDLVARLEEQALEVARLERELGDARRELSRARERIAELELAAAPVPSRLSGQREALTPLFRRTEFEPN